MENFELLNKKRWSGSPVGASWCQGKFRDVLELFCFLFCNTKAFGNLKPKELEELLSGCRIGQADSGRDGLARRTRKERREQPRIK